MSTYEEMFSRAVRLTDTGQCSEAIKLFEEIGKEFPDAYGEIAAIYEDGRGDVARDLATAENYYRKSYEYNPNGLNARSLFLVVLEREDVSNEEKVTAMRVLASSPGEHRQIGHLWLCFAHMHGLGVHKNWRRARRHCEVAALMGNVHALAHLGWMYWREGRRLKGIKTGWRGKCAYLMIRLTRPNDTRLQKH